MGAAEHIELETWELFMAVMESGSYLQPARAMNVDPSTVSRRLRKLEDRLRMQLFYRESTGLRPTAAGRRVMNQMHDVLTDIHSRRERWVGKKCVWSPRTNPGEYSGTDSDRRGLGSDVAA